MHAVMHLAANVGFGLMAVVLVFMLLSNLRIAVDLPLLTLSLQDSWLKRGYTFPHFQEYMERQRNARAGLYGSNVQREARFANYSMWIGSFLLWPDILYHIWYKIGTLF
ncbi:hypothetical protein XaavBphi31_17 [Xanthomonas phage Xaa_vB_phi31]|uniref:Uncharacterized protein n=1 Tax=Xanthomonas phage Xaa_vB_phi31 TaxID=2776752 RepID=A0A868C0G4_9CAUD|nr:hypothetical protein XaavBphi31_17 [Xanthomonas phage Xaa_vB_phi31]